MLKVHALFSLWTNVSILYLLDLLFSLNLASPLTFSVVSGSSVPCAADWLCSLMTCLRIFVLQGLPKTAPVLILLPGLTGGSHDSYVEYCVIAAR